MKKLLTLLFMFILSYGISQSLTVTYEGRTFENNDTLTVNIPYDQSDDVNIYLSITNNSDSAYTLKIQKEEIHLADGALLFFCIAGGCYSGNASNEPYPVLSSKETLESNDPNAFKIQYFPSSGISEASFTFFNVNDTTDKNVLYVILNTAVGIKQTTTSAAISLQAYPNPATDKVTIEYNLVNQPSSFTLKNVMGVTVLEELLYQKAGKIEINLSDIPRGLYFYSIGNTGNAILTKKLIVR